MRWVMPSCACFQSSRIPWTKKYDVRISNTILGPCINRVLQDYKKNIPLLARWSLLSMPLLTRSSISVHLSSLIPQWPNCQCVIHASEFRYSNRKHRPRSSSPRLRMHSSICHEILQMVFPHMGGKGTNAEGCQPDWFGLETGQIPTKRDAPPILQKDLRGWSLIGLVRHLLHRQGHKYHLEPIPHFHVYTVGMRKQQKHSSILQTSCPLQNSVTSQRGNGQLELDLTGLGTNAYFSPWCISTSIVWISVHLYTPLVVVVVVLNFSELIRVHGALWPACEVDHGTKGTCVDFFLGNKQRTLTRMLSRQLLLPPRIEH